jgi:hypothetical protein
MLAELEVKLSLPGPLPRNSMRTAPTHLIHATNRESKGALEHADDHDTAARRKPQSAGTEEITNAIPTVLQPIVTTRSCQR